MTNPNWILRTARMVLTPVGGVDLADLQTIKADPRVFAIMLGGVRIFLLVTPAKAGVHGREDALVEMGPRLRGGNGRETARISEVIRRDRISL